MATPTPQNNSRPDASPLGEGLSHNLLSDLAPLIALFGEQVTKQFLTMSIDWTDNILIALGPLGIMTILVSAIRVAGNKHLKALIGRARESIETAEVELVSSTSYGVCEMWNGVEIVRSFRIPKTSQFVVIRSDDMIRVLPTWQAYMENIIIERLGRFLEQDEDETWYIFKGAPNLSLNTPWSFVSTAERWSWLCTGFFLQSVSLVLPLLVMRTINFQFRDYSYACYVIGTMSLNIGLALCSHVIEGSTTEYDFIPNPAHNEELVVITVQEASNVGDQHFYPYVTVSVPDSPQIRTSRFNNKNYK
ncbi:hypothetical protein HBI81_173520 [Parastagonospora nodorum]|nr:hypothetical protein HBI01_187110 [Parastagonospora nodorum]KAH4292689.1 hypothetical protein HBI02_190210 [Parastagonospora nodorum]KAH4323380.1 hypothetical protein HBI00_185360 [Parastagonospora nodorum]KAH4360060.1 hypothetical protein HBH94_196960 [Parastagonospora nodorum]KAH4454534.1 hypothetical protein HBH90_173110 [Parastagonospora nodorum]